MLMQVVEHKFGQGQTITAAIRKYNRMDITKEELSSLVNIFNQLNSEALPPKLGQSVKIPIFITKQE